MAPCPCLFLGSVAMAGSAWGPGGLSGLLQGVWNVLLNQFGARLCPGHWDWASLLPPHLGGGGGSELGAGSTGPGSLSYRHQEAGELAGGVLGVSSDSGPPGAWSPVFGLGLRVSESPGRCQGLGTAFGGPGGNRGAGGSAPSSVGTWRKAPHVGRTWAATPRPGPAASLEKPARRKPRPRSCSRVQGGRPCCPLIHS